MKHEEKRMKTFFFQVVENLKKLDNLEENQKRISEIVREAKESMIAGVLIGAYRSSHELTVEVFLRMGIF
jgi:sensor histidine kinase regulating citrate/malate metabolism